MRLRDGRGEQEHRADQRVVCRREIVESRDVPPRHDEHVQRRLRVDVSEGYQLAVGVDDLPGNLPRDDLAEQAIGHRSCLAILHSFLFSETRPLARKAL